MTTTLDRGPVLILGPDAPRDQWLTTRRNGIGGSDAAAVLGLDPYRSAWAVYLDKVGELPDQPENKAMRMGHKLEPVVADLFTEDTGITVLPTPGTLAHPDRPWQLVNPDRLTTDGGLLECKTTTQWLEDEWADGETPMRALVQVHHALAVTGLPHAYLAVLIGGRDFRVVPVQRDEQVIDTITAIEAEFWRRVQDREPPPADHRDASLLAKMPAVEGKARVCTPGEAARIRDLQAAHAVALAAEKEATAAKKTAAAQLAQLLGDAEVAVFDGQPIATYQTVNRSGYTVAPTSYRVARFTGRH